MSKPKTAASTKTPAKNSAKNTKEISKAQKEIHQKVTAEINTALKSFADKSKNVDEDEDETNDVTLDKNAMDEFGESFERAIKRSCKKLFKADPELDIGIELLVTLGMICSQVGIETQHTEEEFLAMMKDLYTSSKEYADEDCGDCEECTCGKKEELVKESKKSSYDIN
jgi:hypothetical protein